MAVGQERNTARQHRPINNSTQRLSRLTQLRLVGLGHLNESRVLLVEEDLDAVDVAVDTCGAKRKQNTNGRSERSAAVDGTGWGTSRTQNKNKKINKTL